MRGGEVLESLEGIWEPSVGFGVLWGELESAGERLKGTGSYYWGGIAENESEGWTGSAGE